MSDHKTEQPTPRRRQKAREQGQIARSRELSSALGMFAALALLQWRASADIGYWRSDFNSWLSAAGRGSLNVTAVLLWCATAALRWILPAIAAAWAAVLAASFAQGGFLWAPEALSFRPDRLNPAERVKQLFSINSIAGLLRSLIPGIAIVYLAVGVVTREWTHWKLAPFRSGTGLTVWLFALLFEIAWKSALVMLVSSLADYLLVRYRVESELKMSREELRQEHKESEGDPVVKGRIRRLQRQARRRKMLADVAKAAVVITNPTHYAIALAYSDETPSPVVVAKGRDRLAEQIKQEARWHEVTMVENPPLAHALYRAVPVGHAIPPKLYVAVAEATVLITAINIIAGFLIGVFQLGIPFREALKTYTVLTVGDGLVTMIPSLLVSIAGAIVVTRASSHSSLGTDMGEQLLGRSRPLWIGAAAMFCLALVPGLPKLSFIVMAAGVALLAKRAARKQTVVAAAKAAVQAEPETKHPVGDIADALPLLDNLSLEVGYGLVPVVDTRQGGQLLARVRALRKHLAQQLGFIVPAVHITDNLRLKPHEYVICLRGIEVARWEMQADRLLAISSSNDEPELPGIETREPAFGVGARWITPATRDQAVAAGYAVVDQTSVLATHLAEVIRQNAHELLTRQETKRLLDRLGESHPKLADELVPKLLSLGEVQRVLQQLLREQVSIRDLGTILESMVETAAISKNPVMLVESARQSLSRALVKPLLSADGTLRVLALDAEIEQELSRAFDPQASAPAQLPLQPSFARRLLEGIKRLAGDQLALASPVLLCPTPARFHLRRLLEPFVPKLVVLSPGEVPPAVPVQTLGMVR